MDGDRDRDPRWSTGLISFDFYKYKSYLLRASTAKLGPNSPGRFYTVVITYLYLANIPQLLGDMGNMEFKCLIIKKKICNKKSVVPSSSTLFPPKKTDNNWGQNNIHLQFTSTAKH